ncbi:NUDIX hydrolase, partial [Dysosmobacter welbionis]
DCHQQRRSSDDGVDPVAEGVGQFRQPVGQGVVVVINKHRGQRHCNPHGISVLNNA